MTVVCQTLSFFESRDEILRMKGGPFLFPLQVVCQQNSGSRRHQSKRTLIDR